MVKLVDRETLMKEREEKKKVRKWPPEVEKNRYCNHDDVGLLLIPSLRFLLRWKKRRD